MSVQAGQRDQLIVFERWSETGTNDLNEPVGAWAQLAQAWAMVRWGSSSERIEAARLGGAQQAIWTVDRVPEYVAVTITDRIRQDSTVWNITGIAPIGREAIAFTTVREVG